MDFTTFFRERFWEIFESRQMIVSALNRKSKTRFSPRIHPGSRAGVAHSLRTTLFSNGSPSPILLSRMMPVEKILARALGEDVAQLAAQEKQLLLSRLLARVAHEIRNPLSSLDIHVQLLEEDLAQAPPQVKDKAAVRFEIIHGELHRLENIVKHFLSLAGPSSLHLQAVEVRKVLGHVCELLRPEAALRDIGIALTVPDAIPLLSADPAQLTQALVNLVINAIQAVGARGQVEVAAQADATGDYLSIRVQDSGPGVPKEKQAAIFEPFFTSKPEGSGLGLWVVQQIVMAHGGVVLVGDSPTGGALFTVQFPMRKLEPPHE